MTVDLILVNYFSSDRLRDNYASIRDFFPDATVYLVNNSVDDRIPADVLRAPRTVYIENPTNVGFATAVNQAFRRGRGTYVALVNPDISSISGSFGFIAREFEVDARTAAVAVQLRNQDGTVQDSCRRRPKILDLFLANTGAVDRFPHWRRPKRFRMLDWPHDEPRAVDAACGAFLVLRRSAVADVGLFDEGYFLYWEETDWLLRAQDRGWKTRFTPSVDAVHAGGGSSSTAVDLEYLLVQSGLIFARRRFGRKGEWALRGLLLLVDGGRYVAAYARLMGGGGGRMRVDVIAKRLGLYFHGPAAT